MITGTCDALDFGMVIAEDVIQGIDLPGGLT